MPKPLLLDIVLYFKAHNAVLGDGIDCFRDYAPEKPDAAVVLYEYQGAPKVLHEDTTHRSIQVTVRDIDPDTARKRALELYNLLDKQNLIVQFTPERWGEVSLRQTPFRIKTDANNRAIYGFNIGVTTTRY